MTLPIITTAANAALGIALEGHQDRRQLRQQDKLNEQQYNWNEKTADSNYERQLKMWHDTNYSAQVAEMKKAGINPALMYGEGGGGGTTAAAAPAQGVTSGSAQQGGGGEILGLMRESNLAMQQAQIANLNANTEKAKAEAAKTAGVDTKQTEASIEQIKASTTNIQAQEALTKIQTAISEIEKNTEAEIYDKGGKIMLPQAQFNMIEQQAMQIQNSNWQFSQTKEAVIDTIKQGAINAVLTGEATKMNINVDQAAIQKMSMDILQRGQDIDIRTFEKEWKANHPELGELGGQMLNSIKERLEQIMKIGKDYKNPIKISK